MRRLLISSALITLLSPAFSDADVLYKKTGAALFDGRFGPIREIQVALNGSLKTCGKTKRSNVAGEFGGDTVAAISTVASCKDVADKIPAGDPAHRGQISTALWQALLPLSPVPDLEARTSG
jgi:hypothetical protein